MVSELDITWGLFFFYGNLNWAQIGLKCKKMDPQQR